MAPPAIPLIIAGVVKAVGATAAAIKNLAAHKDFRSARRIKGINTTVKALQARRSFVRAARQAQAQALVRGAGSGASLESSAVQGNLASLQTQEQLGVFEQQESTMRTLRVEQLEEKGKRKQARASGISAITGGASDAIAAFG